MIISELMGGLGNQMFQYAAGRSLADRYEDDYKLDLWWYSSPTAADTHRQLELDIFHTRYKKVTIVDKVKVALGRRLEYSPRLQKYFIRDVSEGNEVDLEKGLPNTDIYLKGFWQSERYFRFNQKKIRDDFEFRSDAPKSLNTVIDRILKSESVFVHIRRGDYITNPEAAKFHGFLGLDYYQRGITYFLKELKTPLFFVFSDDIAWVKTHFKTPAPMVFVDHAEANYEDLRLMSLCKHGIIANSSFSWWGGWLIKNQDKYIIAPKRWFKSAEVKSSHIIPEKWVRI